VQDNLGKPVSEHQMILNFCATARDDEYGDGFYRLDARFVAKQTV